jgi:hypothetical protein
MESVCRILTGIFPQHVNPKSEEFDKQISTRFAAGERFISFDNIVTGTGKAYRNPNISRLLTQGYEKSARILGHSKTVSQTGVLFALTANDCKLDPDLLTRSLPIKLYSERSTPMTPFCYNYSADHRREIYGELLSLIMESHTPIPNDFHPQYRFRKWLSLVYPVVKAHFGEMAIAEVEELDGAVVDLFSWGNDQDDDFTFSTQDLLNQASCQPDMLNGLHDVYSSTTSKRARSTKMARFLHDHCNRPVNLSGITMTMVVAQAATKHEPPRFAFKRENGS